jgi:hypothetical protein
MSEVRWGGPAADRPFRVGKSLLRVLQHFFADADEWVMVE